MTSVSPIVAHSSGNAAMKSKRKRNRVPLSCTICRKRKVKCDKLRPHCEQCSRTGVAHLCHYMEQSWAEEAERERSKESELKALRDRVRRLENQLAKAHAAGSLATTSEVRTPLSVASSTEPQVLLTEPIEGHKYVQYRRPDSDKFAEDELDLTRQFDLLHLKHNGTIHLGVTHWLAIMKGDPYLRLLWAHIFMMREKFQKYLTHKQAQCPISVSLPPTSHSPVVHKAVERPLSAETATPKCPVMHERDLVLPVANARIKKTDILGCIKSQLPPKRIVQALIEKFFNKLYLIIPIIDEQKFKSQIESIMGFQFDSQNSSLLDLSYLEPIQALNAAKETDYCVLGIMILILRITWLSLPQNAHNLNLGPQTDCFRSNPFAAESDLLHTKEPQDDTKEELILLKYEVSAKLVDTIKTKLIKFDEIIGSSNNHVNMHTIQFALFYQFYSMHIDKEMLNPSTPEFTRKFDDIECHQNLLSSIVQMAYSCGLHRDPDNFPQLDAVAIKSSGADITKLDQSARSMKPEIKCPFSHEGPSANGKEAKYTVERFKHTWRKIWFYLVSLDVHQSILLGAPRLLRNLGDFSDTKLPSSSKIDYVKNMKELIVVKNYNLFYQIDLCLIAVLNSLLNVSVAKHVRKFELDLLIDTLVNLSDAKMPIKEILKNLVNSGLLPTSEGVLGNYGDDGYELPHLRDIVTIDVDSRNSSSFSSDRKVGQSCKATSESPCQDIDKRLNLPHESTTRALFFSKHMTLRTMMYLLNYILFTHYEPKGTENHEVAKITREYAQNALNCAIDSYRNCFFFFKNSSKYNTSFNYLTVYLTFQSLDVGHRALQFMICLLLRVKCGPLPGMSEASVISNFSSGSSSCPSSDAEKENTSYVDDVVVQNRFDLYSKIDLSKTDSLAEALIVRMKLFQDLTMQLSSRSQYAARIRKSIGFFLSLLNQPFNGSKLKDVAHSVKGMDVMLANWKHPKISTISDFISGDSDKIKRCPVYQDALGFMVPRQSLSASSTPVSSVTNNTLRDEPLASSDTHIQLPPIRSYRPVTYSNSNVRSGIKKEDTNPYKRQHLDTSVDDRIFGSRGSSPQSIEAPIPSCKRAFKSEFSAIQSLPSIERIAGQINLNLTTGSNTPVMTPSPFAFDKPESTICHSTGSSIEDIQSRRVASYGSCNASNTPLAGSDDSSELEDFFLQNANINGLVLNPSSLMEVVRKLNESDNNYANASSDMDNAIFHEQLVDTDFADFLPIDNANADPLSDLTKVLWE